ncbi:isoaspartyl peptidase/L-asparaginase [Choloepus didactylus]|uniref:isoaspartyl peptidase/L-asparaginase n=1 Tax=Choloepus didactylus TaxID=27675 RepID=UPI00189F4E43|nr:isoaspartyl peptidase/L-asparaginase [Choloepus didactylus]XP_037694330.1 isoaspartyl peptidase/L-asparaginase [Choloepus didactylus]XP_037694331.1 isoaspartyl peptidase/L-asparaginase [Choloepus didactylus]XP_037694332.1 isoaspartyl peptidase/L-asparaginase [Choloepus didactylus]XP_037694333.1 isoaspartyl peptidase/L-asparaginase [Choloepus didactylus]
MNPVVVVHGGGASSISQDRKERVRRGIVQAATVGYNILKEGGSAVDAVEGAVVVLENDPEFNAGCGSVLNVNGEVEMDASIMDGKDLSTGAVSAVRCIANPIKLARLVMEKTPHCFLTDQGAAKFAAAMGIPEIPGEQLVTERSKKHLEKEKLEKDVKNSDCEKNLGTVGAVALDCKGNVAYATSTGGIINKMAGRVGDSPCVGSGGYADNLIGAISTTGHGESILKVNLARLTLFHTEQGKTLEEAADLSLGYMKSRLKGLGGVILVSKTGDWAVKWTSASMPWAAAKDGKLHSGIDVDETTTTNLP